MGQAGWQAEVAGTERLLTEAQSAGKRCRLRMPAGAPLPLWLSPEPSCLCGEGALPCGEVLCCSAEQGRHLRQAVLLARWPADALRAVRCVLMRCALCAAQGVQYALDNLHYAQASAGGPELFWHMAGSQQLDLGKSP